MSSLINDLNTIYNVKGQIKEVANIPTDVFSDFPAYIAAAIASGGATGEIEITTNGTHDVSTYASAYVNVPQETVPVVPEGYTYVEGTKTITENGTVDVSSYASAYVQVPIPEGFIYPTGYAYITTNGDFPIREFQYVNVNVPTSGGLDWDDVAAAGYIVPAGTVNITANDSAVDVSTYAYANVNVPIPSGYVLPAGSKTITANALGIDVSSYAYVDVNVPTGVTPSGSYFIDINPDMEYDGEPIHYNVASYAEVEVDFGSDASVNITTNGNYNVSSFGYTFINGNINVNVPSGITPTGTYNITANGNYDITTYSYAYVDVSGGISDGRNITAVRFTEDSTNYTYLTKTGTEFTYTGYFTGTSGSTPTGGIELAHVELQVRIADETYQEWVDDHYETMPKWRNSGCGSNSVDYFGDWLSSNYGGSADQSIPTGTLITYNLVSPIDEYGAGFGVQNINMYGWENYRVDYTLRIPEDYYYRGSSYTYFDWTITGTRETPSE